MKKLVISPHVDDEVLGCGGVLDQNSFVYYCGIDETGLPPDPGHRIPKNERMAELKATAKFLGFSYEVNETSKVNFYREQDLIAEFERVINKVKPDTIFIPHPGYNQDHRTAFDAAQVALRPHDRNFFIKRVLVYEGVHDQLWAHEKLHVNYFIPINIARKVEAYQLQKSQVRSMRSPDMLISLAKIRGAMSNCEYAEGFSVVRWVE